jgi:hypothetical protein
MRKKMLLKKGVSFVAVAVSVMFLWVAFSAAVVECPDDIVINTEGWPKDKYEPTTLSHKKHATEYKIPCKDCHHVYKDGKNVWAKVLGVPQRVFARQGASGSDRGREETEPVQGLPRQLQGLSQEGTEGPGQVHRVPCQETDGIAG